MLIKNLPVSNRTKNRLTDAGFETVDQLAKRTAAEIQSLPGVGPTVWVDLKECLDGLGVKLAKAAPKEKKKPRYHPRSTELIKLLLPDRKDIFWPKEIRVASELINKYGFDNMAALEVPAKVTSLLYYTGDWAAELILKNARLKVVKDDEKQIEEKEEDLSGIVYQQKTKKGDLFDFLGLK